MSGATRCGVVGSPIAHSLSPLLHRTAYRLLDLDWHYEAHEVAAGGLAAFAGALPDEWRGLSVTMPLKEEALAAASSASETARLVGGANTLVRRPDRGWDADNTDVPGLAAAWRTAGVERVRTALVLGAGATARSAVAALAQCGVERVAVIVRSPDRAAGLVRLAAILDVQVDVSAAFELAERGETVDMAVSTVPPAAQRTLARAVAHRAGVVVDVVYDPPLTPILAAARESGRVAVPGIDLLVEQAAHQIEAMTGLPAPIEAMRSAGVEAIQARGGTR